MHQNSSNTIPKAKIDMEYNWYLRECADDDVLSFGNAMFKVGKFRDGVEFAFSDRNQGLEFLYYAFGQKGIATSNTKDLLGEGVDCEVLRIGAKGWKKGKLRIKVSLEFSPDEPDINQPESPLDDLRQMINQENQQ